MNKKLMRFTAFGTALAMTASVLSLSVYAAPAKYDANDYGYITPVKNQGNWGTCWAFSSTAISEASLIKEFPDKYTASTLDLSENLLAYMISHPSLYGQINSSGDTATYVQDDTYYLSKGGNVWFTGLGLMNGFGPYNESDEYAYSLYGTPSIASKTFIESEYYELKNSSVAKITGLFTANINKSSENDDLKQLIMDYGAASLSYCENYSDVKKDDDGGYYYYNPTASSTNHAVTVVGWDDDIPASSFKSTPEGNGAWLIKNSWGDSRDHGYFWLSYYDKTISNIGVAYDFTVEGADDYYDTRYSYDGGNNAGAFGYSQNDMYGANVFTAQDDSAITGAAVYTAAGTDIELSVYTDLKDKTRPTSGTKSAVATMESVRYEGYYTLQFDAPVKVKKGDTFAIVAKITNSNGSARIYVEYGYSMNGLSYSLKANEGESYYTYNPDYTWIDCTYSAKNNLLIKAYAVSDDVECTEHTYGEWKTTKAATCTEDGTKYRVCTKCNAVENGVIEKLGHDYSTAWTTDKAASCGTAGSKSHHCTRCSAKTDVTAIPATNKHTPGEWKTTKAATCTEDGTKYRVCTKCNAVENGVIEKLGHDYSTAWTTDKAASCGTAGSKSHHCTRCSAKTDVTAIPATNKHTPGEWKTTKAATCTATGTKTKNCSVCGKVVETATIAKTAHKYVNTVVKPTYTAQGYTLHKCSVCGVSYKDNYTAKLTVANMSGYKVKSKTSTSVTLQWNKNTSATGYELQKWDGKKWVALTKITSNATTTYNVESLKASTTYKYRIRAYKTVGKNTYYSGYTELSVNTNPSGMSGYKVKSKTSTSVTLQWNKNTTATGYELQKWDGKKWVALTKLTSNATTTYTVKSLKASTTYKYRIRAYKTIGKATQYSGYTELSVNTNPSGMSGYKVKSKTSTSVTLQWNKNTTATGYELQKWDGKKWVALTKITSNATTTYTVKSLKASTTYKYRIRAYKTIGKATQYSGYAELSVNTNPSGMSGFKVKSTAKTSVTLQWNKNTTATGYELQKWDGKKWVALTKITKNSTTTYTVKSLKANTSYKYRIRAYKTMGKATQYSGYSATVTAKTKK